MKTIYAVSFLIGAFWLGLVAVNTGLLAANGNPSPATGSTTTRNVSTVPDTTEEEFGFGEITLPGLSLNSLNIYGYFASRLEKTFGEPSATANGIIKEDAPAEFLYPSFDLLVQHQITDKFKAFINLNAVGSGLVDLHNFWAEYSASAALNLRMGKVYRKFGLYNEILDAVPTYYGIEPPELFDADHLMLSRTTALMLYGSIGLAAGNLNYSISTDNGEGDAAKGVIPLGYDLHYKFGGGDYTLGVSGYVSGGETTPDVAVGEGPPHGGVLPWMAGDKFSVIGGYLEMHRGPLTLQSEYWHASHHARRDPEAVLTVINNAKLNANQLARFLKNPALGATAENVNPLANFGISTWYVRAGLSRETRLGEFAPYVQWDHYRNPEVIAKKKFGGDNEAGVADDGVFDKSTVGLVFRPIPQVAIKLDQSFHFYRLAGQQVNYWELRLDVSMLYGQGF
ncbi:MAG: hypothetical protein ONB48_20750 [candidate division KSB1 bacterium]|nr:hypothetical protein [candidate division KSB1 bacterium]MDZ7276407.1 hypothetical protein [candidate division KSB1 bacterium]MDZ7288078.1 hypothetical protein [candidate division KSB1 bacterium]MDZ7300178.1 hypothetical protein [candidate division KSB1 bacterium]MDZ7305750.1 hypothetical protein [candidate division KSB1 bacterium]